MEHPVARHGPISGPAVISGGTTAIRAAQPPRHAQTSVRQRPRGEKVAAAITVASALVIAIISMAWLTMNKPTSSGASVTTARHASAAADRPSSGAQASARSSTGKAYGPGSTEKASIQLTEPAGSAKPFQAVPIRGTQPGGQDTLLQVQRSEGNRWVPFPLPTRTDRSGRFATYVELGKPGRYWVRVLDPHSGATSKRFLLVIKT